MGLALVTELDLQKVHVSVGVTVNMVGTGETLFLALALDFWASLEQVIVAPYATLSLQPSLFMCFETLLGVCRSWTSPKYHLPFGNPRNSGYVCVTSTAALLHL